MTQENDKALLIAALKAQYNRDIRKQLVKSLIEAEKAEDTDKQYKLMNQIFSYVLAQMGWTIASNTKEWDANATPLEVMDEVFPKITSTQWYNEQKLLTNKTIDVRIDNKV